MVISESIHQKIIDKAKQYDDAKNETIEKIRSYIRVAVEKLEAIQKELLSEVDIKYGNNPFLRFEADKDKKNNAEAQKLLSQKIPQMFGPNEEFFKKLLKDIVSFRAWQEKPKYIPKGLSKDVKCDSIKLSWEKAESDCVYAIELRSSSLSSSTPAFSCSLEPEFTFDKLNPGTAYKIRVCSSMLHDEKYSWSEWSKPITILTQDAFYGSVWKKCPEKIYWKKKYDVDERNPRVATKVNDNGDCTIIGNTHIPKNRTTSWSIKILKSACNNGSNIYIGVAPSNINQNDDDNYKKCGWYFNCWNSELYSGPPHNFKPKRKTYGLKKEGDGQHVHTGDSVGVVVDTRKGELSFVLNGVNYGVAYKGIPLDKPLVPCVILYYQGDSVELDTSEVKENVDTSIPAPSNIAMNITWDTTTLTWDEVSDASFYQIEMDGSISCYIATIRSFTKKGLPETEYSFRVRAVRGSSVSEWSNVVKETTLTSWWKECPDGVDDNRKYSVDEKNPKTVAKINNDGYCTIIENKNIPLNKVSSWSIKILKSKNNDGSGIFVGITPSDINQNEDNYNNYGWYFYCGDSTLYSGPHHKYSGKIYGPRKWGGQYVHAGDSVGVVVDTTKGELSFVLDGVNCGVAYEKIPLDKPLVPCVILGYEDDSVELFVSKVKENVDSSILVPPNITAKGITWDSITLAWDEVEDASFYQVEVDGSKSWDASTTNSFTKGGLLPETEHSFRVRVVRGSSVSKWSDVVKGKTLKAYEGVWKKCPVNVDFNRKYSVDENNPRIATKINYDICTIIGNAFISRYSLTLWSIKVLKSKDNNGCNICIGVAPYDINQDNNSNYNKYGWYFDCYGSRLWSGPLHNYNYSGNEYGPRKGDGQYVHTGDSVGVVMDTTRGDLSFVLNNVNYGVAYCGIPLDKPLVPCVLLRHPGDSVQLVI